MNFSNLHAEETDHLFRSFCTFICIAFNKKYNLANILLLYLQNKNVKGLFNSIFFIESDITAVRLFLEFDPSLCKSKYIMKYLNKAKK